MIDPQWPLGSDFLWYECYIAYRHALKLFTLLYLIVLIGSKTKVVSKCIQNYALEDILEIYEILIDGVFIETYQSLFSWDTI